MLWVWRWAPASWLFLRWTLKRETVTPVLSRPRIPSGCPGQTGISRSLAWPMMFDGGIGAVCKMWAKSSSECVWPQEAKLDQLLKIDRPSLQHTTYDVHVSVEDLARFVTDLAATGEWCSQVLSTIACAQVPEALPRTG